MINRREAVRLMAGVWAGVACRQTKPALAGGTAARSALGLVIYCCNLRQRTAKQETPARDLFQPLAFLEHCHQLGAGGVQVPLGVCDAEAALRLRRRAETLGMFVEGIINPPAPSKAGDLERFAAEMETAARVGARAVRTVVIPGRRYEFFTSAEQFAEADRQARRSLELAAPIAEQHRVRLAVENHKDHRLDERIALLRHISSPWVGACVDTGNSFALLEDPLEVVRGLAPWAFSVHLKDQAVQEYPAGFLLADVPLGQGFLDLEAMISTLRQSEPDVCFSLELITRDPLAVPCLTDKYWTTFAGVRGQDLARTLRVVRHHAAQQLPQVDQRPLAEQVTLEEQNLRASLEYARNRLRL